MKRSRSSCHISSDSEDDAFLWSVKKALLGTTGSCQETELSVRS